MIQSFKNMLLGSSWESRRAKGQSSTASPGIQLTGASCIVVSSGLWIVVCPYQCSVLDYVSSGFIIFTMGTKTVGNFCLWWAGSHFSTHFS